jgi:hypothetical protein
MGACIAGEERQFAATPALTVQDVLSKAEVVDQRVHIVGRVGHAGSVLESPFEQKPGVAMKVTAMTPSGGHGGGAQKMLFNGKSVVNFYIVDGASQILIDVGTDQSKWDLRIKKSDDVWNIYREHETGQLVSGGTGPGQKEQVKPRPQGRHFWDTFNAGKDSPDNMTAIGGKGMAGFGNRPRMAREYVLSVNDVVAVIGILRKTADGLRIEADSESIITNNASVAKSVGACKAGEDARSLGAPSVEWMKR